MRGPGEGGRRKGGGCTVAASASHCIPCALLSALHQSHVLTHSSCSSFTPFLPPLQAAVQTMHDFQSAQWEALGRADLPLEMLCAIINNNVRCYDESLEFASERGQAQARGVSWQRLGAALCARRNPVLVPRHGIRTCLHASGFVLHSAHLQPGSTAMPPAAQCPPPTNFSHTPTHLHPSCSAPSPAGSLERTFAEHSRGQLDIEEACRGFLELAKEAVAASVAVSASACGNMPGHERTDSLL